MLTLSVFTNAPELLGGTQTAVGVLLTLLVLCIFSIRRKKPSSPDSGLQAEESNDLISSDTDTDDGYKNAINTNFVHQLCEDFWYDLSRGTKKYTQALRTTLKQRTQEKNDEEDEFWRQLATGTAHETDMLENRVEASFIQQRFFQYAQNESINRHNKRMQTLLEREEDAYIEFHLFLICLLVFALDFCHVQANAGSVFMYVLTALSFVYTSGLWMIYFKQKNPNVIYDLSSKRTFWRWIGFSGFIVVGYLLWCLVMLLPFPNIIIYFLTLLLIAAGATVFCVRRRWKGFSEERHNKYLVVKHTFYIIATSLIVSLALLCAIHYSFIYSLSNTYFRQLFELWCQNAGIIISPRFSRIIFAAYISVSAFAIPILGVSLASRHHSNVAKKEIENQYKQMLAEREKLDVRYNELKKSIMEEYTRKNNTRNNTNEV